MNRIVVAVAVLLAMGVIVGGMVWSGEKDKHEQEKSRELVGLAMAANVTIDQAIKTALENFPGDVIEAELGQRHDQPAWKVDVVTADRDIMVVEIDAESGTVLDTNQKLAGPIQDHGDAQKS